VTSAQCTLFFIRHKEPLYLQEKEMKKIQKKYKARMRAREKKPNTFNYVEHEVRVSKVLSAQIHLEVSLYVAFFHPCCQALQKKKGRKGVSKKVEFASSSIESAG
jgi:hypothetical protein